MLARVLERFVPQVATVVINANEDDARFSPFGLPVVGDSVEGYAGPLAGVHAGLEWAKTNLSGVRHIVTVAADTPFLPTDLVQRFLAHSNALENALVVARSAQGIHPVFGLWPVSAADALAADLQGGARKVTTWLAEHDAVEVHFPAVTIKGRTLDPFFNINRPEDLAEAEALIGSMPRPG